MTYTSSVTQKGQITLPKSFRDKLNINTREKVTITFENDYIKITPTKDIVALAGFLSKKVVANKRDVLELREVFEGEYIRE